MANTIKAAKAVKSSKISNADMDKKAQLARAITQKRKAQQQAIAPAAAAAIQGTQNAKGVSVTRSAPKKLADFNSAADYVDYLNASTPQNEKGNAVSQKIKQTKRESAKDILVNLPQQIFENVKSGEYTPQSIRFIGEAIDALRNPKPQNNAVNAPGIEQLLPDAKSLVRSMMLNAIDKQTSLPLARIVNAVDAARSAYNNSELGELDRLYTKQIGMEDRARRDADIARYERVRGNSDFADAVGVGRSLENPAISFKDFYNTAWTGNAAEEYEKLMPNPVQWARENAAELIEIDKQDRRGQNRKMQESGLYNPLYLYMTDDQYDTYSYYVGKGDKAQADAYFKSIEQDLREKRNAVQYQTYEQWAAEHPGAAFFETALDRLVSVPGAFEGAKQAVNNSQLFGDGIDRPLDVSTDAFGASRRADAYTTGSMSAIDSPLGQFGYNVASSMRDNAVAMGAGYLLGPGASAAILSTESATDAMYQAGKEGLSAQDALQVGVINGGWEYLTEKIAFEKMFDMFKRTGGKMDTGTIKAILEQAGFEATEEYANSILSTMTERVLLGGNSSYDRFVGELMDAGYTRGQAVEEADKEFYWKQPLESAAAGFVSGGIMSTTGAVTQSAINRLTGRNDQQTQPVNAQEQTTLDTLAGIAQRAQTGENTIADTVAEKILTGEKPGNSEIRQLQAATGPVRQAFAKMTGIDITGMDSTQARAAIGAASKEATVTKEKAAQYFGELQAAQQRQVQEEQAAAAQYGALSFNAPDASAVGTIDATRQGGAPLEVVNAQDTGNAAGMAEDFRQRQISGRRAANNGASLDTITNDRVRDKAKKLDRALETFGISNAVNASDLGSVHEMAADGVLNNIIDSAARGIANTLENMPRYSEVQKRADKYGLDAISYISEVIKAASGEAWSIASRGDVNLLRDVVNNPDAAASIESDTEQANKTKGGDASVDSDGNKLSQKQIDYLKNSKVRDANGKLMKMYHGTSAFGFNTFDLDHSKWGLFGPGLYFTSDRGEANWGYAQTRDQGGDKGVYETYLNITNPVPIETELTRAEWDELFDQLSIDEQAKNAIDQWLDGNASHTIESFLNDMVVSVGLNSVKIDNREWLDAMRSRNWDGIIKNDPRGDGSSDVYAIAFNSEQIKRTDNRNPTENADIRFRLTGSQYNAPALEYALEEDTLSDAQIANLTAQLRDRGIDLSENPDTQELLEAVDMLDNMDPGFVLNVTEKQYKTAEQKAAEKAAREKAADRAERKRVTEAEKQRKAEEAEQRKAAVAERRAKTAAKKAAAEAARTDKRINKSITDVAKEHVVSTERVAGKHSVRIVNPEGIIRGLEGDARAEFTRQLDSINEFGKAFGHRVRYFTGRMTGVDGSVSGFYHNGEVYVNVDNIRAAGLKTVAHEICHDIAAKEPSFVNSFYRLYREYCESNGMMSEFNRRWNDIYNNSIYPQKQLAIAEEVLAEMFGEYASGDSEFLNYCLGERPNLITRIVEAFNRILTKLHLKKYSKASADAMELRNFLLGAAARYQMNQTGREMKLSAGIRSDYRNAQRKAEAIGDRYVVLGDSGVNLTEWDTTGLAAPEEYRNLKRKAPDEVTNYGFKHIPVSGERRNVLIVNPTRYITEGVHADMIASSRSLAATLGIRLGFISGNPSTVIGEGKNTREQVLDRDFVLADDGTVYVNLDSEVPYTKIVAGAWWSQYRKAHPAAAANLERLAERNRALSGDDRIAQDYAVGMLTRTNAQGLKALNLNPETLVERLSDRAEAVYAFAHERSGVMRKLFENAGDMVAKLTKKQDYRAAYISGQLQARLMKAFSETSPNRPGGDKIETVKRKTVAEGMLLRKPSDRSQISDATIAKNRGALSSMSSVASLRGTEFQKGEVDLITQVSEYFESVGGSVVNPVIGEVALNRRGVKASVGHKLGRNKAIAFKAVPDIIRDGTIISYVENYRNRQYDAYVIAAPITIAGERFYAGAVVNSSDTDQSYYLHEVIIEKDDNAPFKTGPRNKAENPGDASSSIFSLLRQALDVNPEKDVLFSARRDNNTVLREPTRTERREWLGDYADTYGEIPEGEDVNSRGDQRIPRRTDSETKTRQTYRTYAEALTTPDDFVGELEKEIVDGRASYTPLSNKAAAGYAEHKLAEGMDEAMATWNAVTHGDVIADKNQIALGERLIMEAINNRDVKLFTKLVAEVAAEATRAGQMVQAISMVKRLSPEGQLVSFRKEVSKLNESLANRKGHPQITPDETLTQEYMDIASELESVRQEISELEGKPESQRTERQQDAIDSLEAQEKKLEQQLKDKKNEMITDAAEQIPPTWMDKLRAWRYLAMLGNPRTHIRNLLGNAVFIPAVRIKQGIAGGIERMVRIKPGERTQGISASKELRAFAREDAKTQLDILATGGKYNQTDAIAAEQKPFDDNRVIGKTLNKLAEINSAALEGEDAFFLRKHYEFALSRFAAANKWTVEYLKRSPEALAKARGFAYREAQRATYRDLSSFAQLMSKVSNKLSKARGFGKLGYMMFEGAMPFKKTPCNIMKRGVEYSPLGIASAISKGAIMLRDRHNDVQSDYSGTEFINDLAAGLTGTMIMGLGYLLTSLGILHGRDKDEEDEINAIQGVQEYSVIVGGHSYTVDWVTPVAFPLFVGSELYDQISADRDGYSMDDFYNSLAGIAEPLFSLSMMDGIQSMMQSYSSEGAIFEAGVSAAESYAGQYFPTLSGQLARTVTPEVHSSSYRDKTDAMPEFLSGVTQKAMAKIPGAYGTLPEMIDVWGRNVGAGESWQQRAAENFLSPGYLNRIEVTDADRLVQDLYRETGDAAVIPGSASKHFDFNGERYDMSPDEYVAYAKTRGKTSYGVLTEFYGSNEFRQLTPEQQVSCVETAYKFATAIAKSQTNSGYVIDTKWQREAYDAFLAGETTLAKAIIEYKTK